jgi:hypothetical protein
MTTLRTIAGTEVDVQGVPAWNDRMFHSYGSDRLYHHPNFLVHKIQARRIQTVLDFMAVTSSDAVLDVGCGEGHFFTRLRTPRWPRRSGISIVA